MLDARIADCMHTHPDLCSPFELAKLHTYHVDPRNPVGKGQWKVWQTPVQVCIPDHP